MRWHMKIKIRKFNIFEIVVLLYLLLETRFFYLVSMGKVNNFVTYKNKMLIAIVTALMVMFFFILKKKINICSINKWCLIFITYCVFEALRNKTTYNLNLNQMLLAFHGYLLFLLCVFLNACPDRKRLSQFIIKTLTLFSVILSTLFVFQAFVYNTFRYSFLKINEYQSLAFAETRSWGIRLTFPGTLIIFSLLISWGVLQKKKNDKLHIFNIVLGGLYIVYVCQTRMTTLVIICTMLLVLVFNKVGRKYSILKKAIVIIMALTVLLAPLYIDSIFDSNTGSVYARTYAYKFYIEKIVENPLFGIGLLPDDKTNATITKTLHGDLGYANITDVGIVGYSVQFGIVGIILLIALVLIIYGNFKRYKKKDNIYYSCLACCIYILGTCSTLSIFDTQRIVMLPFVLFLINCLESGKPISVINV